MKSFKQFISEAPRLSDETREFLKSKNSPWEVIMGPGLPMYLQSRVVREIFELDAVYTLHITSADITRLKQLLRMSNTQKGLSTTTTIDNPYQMVGGIDSGGGVIFLMKGEPVLSSPIDFYSEVDSQGVRYFDLHKVMSELASVEIAKQMLDEFRRQHEDALKQVIDTKFPEVWEYIRRLTVFAKLLPKTATLTGQVKYLLRYTFEKNDGSGMSYLPDDAQLDTQKLKMHIVKAYYEVIGGILRKYKSILNQTFSAKAVLSGQFKEFSRRKIHEAANEIVINRFTIEKAYVLIASDKYRPRLKYGGEGVLSASDFNQKAHEEVFDQFTKELKRRRIPIITADAPLKLAQEAQKDVKKLNKL